MGHSVGAYILLELIRQHRMRIDEGEEDFDLIGGILLFPTITHIAQSPLGMIYNVSLPLRPICSALISYTEALSKNPTENFANPIFPSYCQCSRQVIVLLDTSRNSFQDREDPDAVS
jgi:hypothetical protein